MFEKENCNKIPSMKQVSDYVNNPTFDSFIQTVSDTYGMKPVFEFSKCSFEYGWNIKMKKGSRNLCTIYPKEMYFTVLVVIGKSETKRVEELLPTFHPYIQSLYRDASKLGEQKWLMMDLEDQDKRFIDTLTLIEIRKQKGKQS